MNCDDPNANENMNLLEGHGNDATSLCQVSTELNTVLDSKVASDIAIETSGTEAVSIDEDKSQSQAAVDSVITLSIAEQERQENRRKFNETYTKYDFRCPLSSEFMTDPVLAEDGIIYERLNIEQWFDDCSTRGVPITSPATAQIIGRNLKDDETLKIKISSECSESKDIHDIPSIHNLRAVFAELDPLREFLSESLRGWQPPQFVVIGQESSGKSTLLERLAMMPIFPRDNSFCTRMPLHVRLRHSEKSKIPRMEVFNVETNQTEEGPYFIPVRWAALDVKQKMMEILKDESDLQGVSSRRILVITVEGPRMPSIDLVDMPGLVSSPPELKEQTRLIVQQHIQKHQNYSMFLVTIPGDMSPNISIAMDVIQEMSLQDKALGVFTMCDDIQPRKLEMFRERLQLLPTEAGSNSIQRGWVATMNAPGSISGEMSPLQNLHGQAQKEEEFFKMHLPDLRQDSVSCRALVQRMNDMYANHLKDTWAPATIDLIESACERAQDVSSKLGLPEFHQNFEQAPELAALEAKEILEKGLPDIVQACFNTTLQVLQRNLSSKLSRSNHFERPEQVVAWIQDQECAITGECKQAALDIEENFISGIKNLLEKSENRSFRLSRFPDFIQAILSQSKAVLHDTKVALDSTIALCIKTFFGEMSPWVSMKIVTDSKQASVVVKCQTDILVDNITFVFVRNLPVQSLIDGALKASLTVKSWTENCFEERVEVLCRLNRLRAAQLGISNLLGVNLENMLNERKQVNR